MHFPYIYFCPNDACFGFYESCFCDLLLFRGVGAVVQKLVEMSMRGICVVHKLSNLYIDDSTESLGWQYATITIFITFTELSLCVAYIDIESFFMHFLCIYICSNYVCIGFYESCCCDLLLCCAQGLARPPNRR